MKNGMAACIRRVMAAALIGLGISAASAVAAPSLQGWTQIGYAAPDGGMFDGNCNLRMTGCTFGSPTSGDDFWTGLAGATEILFVTRDRLFWGQASMSEIDALMTGGTSGTGDFSPNLHWISAGRNGTDLGASVVGNLLMRTNPQGYIGAEDPWITLQGGHCASSCGEMLWGENNFGGAHQSLQTAHQGIEVYARITSAAASVPEPGSLALLGTALLGLGALKRRKS